jgi:hypothetical protein
MEKIIMQNPNNKNVPFIIIAILFISINSISAQKTFEGKVKIKITSKDQIITMDYFVKGKNLKMEIGNGEKTGSFIMKGNKYLVLMPAQKMYMEIDSKILENLPGMRIKAKNNNNSKNFNINKFKTGKTKKILGYNCEQWIINDNSGQVEAWVTNELGNFMTMDSPTGGGYSPVWSSYLKDNGFFPMVVISSNKNGKSSKFEVVDVNKMSLSNSEFAPPSNYKKMNIPGM